MSTISSKLQLTTAVFAVAATATLAPIAFADDTDTTSTDTGASVGTAAGSAPTRSTRKDRTTPTNPFSPAPTTPSTGSNTGSSTGSTSTPSTGAATPDSTPDRASTAVDAGAAGSPGAKATAPSAVGENPLFQNPLIWIGTPNPNPPPGTLIYEFEPLENLPEFTRPMYGWMENFNFEACVLGVGTVVNGQTVVGPYGSSTTGVSTSGCA